MITQYRRPAAAERRIASGNYASQSAVIRAALRALEVVEQEQAFRLRELDAAIARGNRKPIPLSRKIDIRNLPPAPLPTRSYPDFIIR
jgi:putative addiction module CopG family antidote